MNKYTVKLILRSRVKNKAGQSPIYIRITIDRKTSFISTGHYINPKTWDERSQQVKDTNPLADIINADIMHRKSTLLRSIVDTQIKGKGVTAAELKSKTVSKVNLHNIFEFIEQFSKEVRHKRTKSTLENYRKHALRLELFHGSRSLNFEEITPAYLQRYDDHLRETVCENYAHTLFKTLKSFFNAAKKKGLITYYPFEDYENPVYRPPVKDYLTLAELAKWEEFADTVTNPVLKQTATYFLLGCYSGLRISDWFAFDASKNIINGKLKLRAKKNGTLVLMPISKPLQRTLDRMAKLSLRIEEPTLNEKLKVIAGKLGIDKYLTSHTGRHTFAITICAEQGVSCETAAELMGIQVKTCLINYYKTTIRKIDQETLAAWEGLT